MNKKGVGFDMETLVAFLIIILVGVALLMAWNTFSGKGFSQLKNVQDKVTDSSFLDLTILGKKSQLLEEKEKCDSLPQNPKDCMGVDKEKTGCFWGKIDNQVGCYSCIVKKSYFGNDYGKCHGYLKIFLSPNDSQGNTVLTRTIEEEDEIICNFNPCDFESVQFSRGQIKTDKCIFKSQVESDDFTQLLCQ